MKRRSLALFAACTFVSRFALAAQTDVPIKQIVLFSSGVGYFEHDGTVGDNDSTELRFKTGQINDILKSLVLQDMNGGKIGVITYPSQDPVDKTLKSFAIDITDNPSLAQLLGQLRGAKVSVTSQAEKVSGTVLGVEEKRKPVEKGEPVTVSVVNLLSGATIRSIELDSVSNLSIDDPALQAELTKALETLAGARDKDKKPVTINFLGSGQREVKIGYVVETPIWKTSYRLILPDEKAQDKAEKPKLQGWAIIENQTDNDWKDVQLSLVSGRPISFVMNLYQPLYIPRPVITPELYASLRPQTYADAVADESEAGEFHAAANKDMPAQMAANSQLRRELNDRARNAVVGGGFGGVTSAPMAQSINAAASVATVASATNIGDLFEYNVGSVNLARQKSAMLPIVTDDVEAERVSIYNQAVLPRNPLTGVRLKNTTGKSLMQGPMTVLDTGVYAGDSKIDDLPPGQDRLLSYGIDLGMTVDTPHRDYSNDILSGKIVRGVLQLSRKSTSSIEYVSENKGAAAKTLIIEQPLQPDWKLVEPAKADETTPSVYRFKGSVPAHKSSKLTVKTEHIESEAIAILPADINGLIEYSRTGQIPKEVRDALIKAIQIRQSVVDLEQQIADHGKRIDAITTEQGRIRDNMKTVDKQSQYYNRLLTKLNEQESQLEKLQAERDDLTAKRDEARKSLEDYLNNLSIG